MKTGYSWIVAIALTSVASFAQEAELSASVESQLFPRSVLSRPFTMPQGGVEAALTSSFGDTSPENTKMGVAAEVGITNDLSFKFEYGGMQFKDATFSKSVTPSINYFLFAVPHLAQMIYVELPVYFDGEQAVRSASIGLPTAIGIAKGWSLMTLHYNTLGFSFDKGQFGLDIAVPVQLGWQATRDLYVTLGTELATFHINQGKAQDFIWTITPAKLKGTYAFHRAFDVFAKAGFNDVQHAGDTFAAQLGLAYRFGAIDG